MSFFNFKSKTVKAGTVRIGGGNPVVVQSMTSANTMDTNATVEQSIRMIDEGCEIVRITAPGVREAENLRLIKKELGLKGYDIPLIADIHYQPKAAMIAAEYVEKVRINPGNYVDRKRGKVNYTDQEYTAELDKIKTKLNPLVQLCKQKGVSMRIGSNHGSLSERILLKYGDTPAGMVESALEFVKICEELDYKELVLSMKASNVKVMIQANRFLVKRMQEDGMNYPIHLGVTEAGDADDGRMKSAAGIGPLLVDGIGDTIRVSLTEEPENEIPVARKIIEFTDKSRFSDESPIHARIDIDLYNYDRRKSTEIGLIGGMNPPAVILNGLPKEDKDTSFTIDFIPDYVLVEDKLRKVRENYNELLLADIVRIKNLNDLHRAINQYNPTILLLFDPDPNIDLREIKMWFSKLREQNIDNPVILKRKYGTLSENDLIIKASIDFSYFLSDGLLDGILIESDSLDRKRISEISFGILQATGERISKTEYIACPSCGRTQFNIQRTLQEIKKRTGHLKGIRIGVMGCCVNGPGEMADADYGYVGAGRNKITLYRRKQIVKQGVPESEAVDELINIIKTDGKWKVEQ